MQAAMKVYTAYEAWNLMYSCQQYLWRKQQKAIKKIFEQVMYTTEVQGGST